MKIKEYYTVCNDENYDFDEWINEKLEDGFCLYGDPYAVESTHCQVVVKYEEEPKDEVKERKVVDVIIETYNDQSMIKERRDFFEDKGWVFVSSHKNPCHFFVLKMVKYE